MFMIHTECVNYQQSSKKSIERIESDAGQNYRIDLARSTLMFVTRGRVSIMPDSGLPFEVGKGQMVFFTPGGGLTVTALPQSAVVCIRMHRMVRLCEERPLDTLRATSVRRTKARSGPNLLKMNNRIEVFVESLAPYLEDGLTCSVFAEQKSREIMHLLSGYYPRNELAAFFSPLLTKDLQFSTFIWEHYHNVRSVEEFAQMSTYSLSMFKQKFKEVFGIPPLRWMNEQRARNIYHQLSHTEKSLENIAQENHFTSVSYLCTFCRNNLSQTASEIRKKHR